jgi:hypothetical protein
VLVATAWVSSQVGLPKPVLWPAICSTHVQQLACSAHVCILQMVATSESHRHVTTCEECVPTPKPLCWAACCCTAVHVVSAPLPCCQLLLVALQHCTLLLMGLEQTSHKKIHSTTADT